ncbi:hypothetical protein QYF36_014080 [Acer negundo]|nr:hypothetical protein QYF36_014080 [Acer negundo]
MAGIGGVLRNSGGMVLYFFSVFIGIQDAISVELMAIEKAYCLCVQNSAIQGQVIEIVSDYLSAVSWINSDTFGSLAHGQLVYGIRDYVRKFRNLSVRYCSRASNSYADNLARKGANREGDVIQWGSI